MFRYLLRQRVKFGSSLCQINRVRQPLGTRTLGNVTYALVVSKLYFCSPVWSSSSKKNISKLQKVQNFKNFNARIITNTWKFDHITPVLQELRWLVGVLAFKCAKGLAISYLSDCFVTRSAVHDRNTRNNDYLNIYSSLSIGRRSTNFSI